MALLFSGNAVANLHGEVVAAFEHIHNGTQVKYRAVETPVALLGRELVVHTAQLTAEENEEGIADVATHFLNVVEVEADRAFDREKIAVGVRVVDFKDCDHLGYPTSQAASSNSRQMLRKTLPNRVRKSSKQANSS